MKVRIVFGPRSPSPAVTRPGTGVPPAESAKVAAVSVAALTGSDSSTDTRTLVGTAASASPGFSRSTLGGVASAPSPVANVVKPAAGSGLPTALLTPVVIVTL